MQFACGGPVVAVREGRVMAGKVQVMNSSETFTLVLSKKDITFSEAFENEAYANLDPAYLEQHGEIARLLEYDDTEECVYKGDRGNILYFTTKSGFCDKPCDDMKYLLSSVTHGPLLGILSTACKTIVWMKKRTDAALDYVLIQDDAFQNIVYLARPRDVPQYIEDYVRGKHTDGHRDSRRESFVTVYSRAYWILCDGIRRQKFFCLPLLFLRCLPSGHIWVYVNSYLHPNHMVKDMSSVNDSPENYY